MLLLCCNSVKAFLPFKALKKCSSLKNLVRFLLDPLRLISHLLHCLGTFEKLIPNVANRCAKVFYGRSDVRTEGCTRSVDVKLRRRDVLRTNVRDRLVGDLRHHSPPNSSGSSLPHKPKALPCIHLELKLPTPPRIDVKPPRRPAVREVLAADS